MKPRVCAVSYLNTTPLVWGLLHGPQRGAFDLRFEIPAVCASLLRSGEVDIGLVPAIELERQAIEIIPGLGIASRGPVRSILLISQVPVREIRTLALDESSRTSVVLARLLLSGKFGIEPRVISMVPDLEEMLRAADACLIIGDPALRVHPASGWHVYDLGGEWTQWTNLPMVYAVWAARAGFDRTGCAAVLEASWRYGMKRIDEITETEHAARGISAETAHEYLVHNIHFELTPEYMHGLARFRSLARDASLV